MSLCGSYSASLHTLTFILYYYYSLINHIGYAPIRELQLLIPSIQSYRYVPIRELHLWIHSKFIPTTNRPYYSLRYIYMLDINISIYLITSFCEITICTLSESANSNRFMGFFYKPMNLEISKSGERFNFLGLFNREQFEILFTLEFLWLLIVEF